MLLAFKRNRDAEANGKSVAGNTKNIFTLADFKGNSGHFEISGGQADDSKNLQSR
jgi:hypothetical protein